MEINDPYLAELVRRVEAGESIVHNTNDLDEEVDGNEDKEKIEALTEIIGRAERRTGEQGRRADRRTRNRVVG